MLFPRMGGVFMKAQTMGVGLLAIGLTGLAGPVPTGLARCSIAITPFIQWGGSTILLGAFRGDRTLASAGPIETSFGYGHKGWAADSAIWGHSFAIEAAHGWWVGGRAENEPSLPQDALVVLWDYGPDCSPTPYETDGPVAEVGAKLLAEVRMRDRDDWVAGRATFDAFYAGGTFYPRSVLTAWREMRVHLDSILGEQPRWERHEYLSPDQVFQLSRELPPICEYRRQPAQTLARYTWTRLRWQADLDRPPADLMFQLHARYSGDSPAPSRCLGNPRAIW